MRVAQLTTTTAASSPIETTPPFGWSFGLANDKEIVLRGATQMVALNANAVSFSTGTALACDVSFTESPN
jgi:hypothetical protein